VLGPDELRQHEVFRRDHPDGLTIHLDLPPALELLDLVVAVMSDDDVDFLQRVAMDDAEDAAGRDCVLRGRDVDHELRPEHAGQAPCVWRVEHGHEIDVRVMRGWPYTPAAMDPVSMYGISAASRRAATCFKTVS
jgi:hypothetical protein